MKLRAGLAIAAVALIALPASAYYHFVTYLNGAPVASKFDLTALQFNTVSIFVSENGPNAYIANDSFNSVMAQISQASQVWNGVASSGLRVSFGGLENSATAQNTPGIDVEFEDLAPGVEALGGPTTATSPVISANGSPFFPILRSVVYLNRNMTIAPGPSYNEMFFLTTLHEIGHALGLQHTFTSATMSQATTRDTSIAHPLSDDDIAGISTLYPNGAFAQFGSISGQITSGGNPVHLASVVAIRAGYDAISAITNPDGTYEIDGLPAGSYYVYVHTIPPDADIIGPFNADGSTAAPSGPVSTLFYGGTPTLVTSNVVQVQAGAITPAINIATTSQGDVAIYDGQVYNYFNNSLNGNTPADVSLQAPPPGTGSAPALAASLVTDNNGATPGALTAQPIGGAIAIDQIYPYSAKGFTYYGVQLGFKLGAQIGPQHVVFSTPGYTYVLPAALNLTAGPPPTIAAATANGDGTVTVTGTTFAPDTRIYFDGLPASISSMNPAQGSAVVVPPPGASQEQAIVSAFNSDGQSSQQVQTTPVIYTYGVSGTPVINTIAPSSLPAGAEASIDITGSGFNFSAGQTWVGFGTSDILVQQIFVLSPTHLQVNVLVSSKAALSTSDVSVIAGFQSAVAPGGFHISAPVAGLPVPYPPISNAIPGLTGAYPGAIVSLYGLNLAAANATPVVTVAGQPVTMLFSSPSQLNLQLPGTLTPGPALLMLNNGALNAYPITVTIANLPAAVNAVQTTSGAYIDTANPLHAGQSLIVTLNNFAPLGTAINPSQVTVSIGGVSHAVFQVSEVGPVYQVYFNTNAAEPVGPSEQVIVYLNGVSSYPATIPVVSP